MTRDTWHVTRESTGGHVTRVRSGGAVAGPGAVPVREQRPDTLLAGQRSPGELSLVERDTEL